MNVILLGAPGCGKGTQAGVLTKKYGIVHVSTGNIFREEMAKKSELGTKVEDYLHSGRLVPDELTIEIVKNRISQPDMAGGFLMDGFPRTVVQAEALDNELLAAKKEVNVVVNIELPDEEVVKRLSSRRQCSACGKIYNLETQPPKEKDKCDAEGAKLVQRDDDMPVTVQKRLLVFHDLTQPLISYYHAAGLLQTVSGSQGVQGVSEEIFKILDGLKK